MKASWCHDSMRLCLHPHKPDCGAATRLSPGPFWYRSFHLKSNVAAVSLVVGLESSTPTTLHRQPALLQSLQWRPSRWGRQLRLAVHRSCRSESTSASTTINVLDCRGGPGATAPRGSPTPTSSRRSPIRYGARVTPLVQAGRASSNLEKDAGTLLARWGSATERLALDRAAGYVEVPDVVLILTDMDLARLADKAATESLRRDELDAPGVRRLPRKRPTRKRHAPRPRRHDSRTSRHFSPDAEAFAPTGRRDVTQRFVTGVAESGARLDCIIERRAHSEGGSAPRGRAYGRLHAALHRTPWAASINRHGRSWTARRSWPARSATR